MKRFLLSGILFLSFLVVSTSGVLAAEFAVTKIGTLTVDSDDLDEITYTNSSVTFAGTASPSASVSVEIDTLSKSVTATTLGNWTYTTTLANGDHDVTFESGDEIIAFTLTIDEPTAATTSSKGATTPVSGNGLPTFLILLSGIVTIFLGGFFWKKNYLKA